MFSDQILHYFNFFFKIQDRETGISRRSDVSLCKNIHTDYKFYLLLDKL